MSTGSASIPLLKAAPEADQVAERLAGGPWAGLELCLMPGDVATTRPRARRSWPCRRRVRRRGALTAEAPVSWPSGAFVRVDRLDAEARAGIERSARFAAAIGSPVLTIHLFIPQTPEEFRAAGGVDEPAVEAFLRCFAQECGEHGVTPLIENVPPVLRMRTGGVFLTPIGGHWRDLLLVAGAGPVARLHAGHLPRRAVPHVRRRVPVALGPGGRGGPGARPLRRGARAGGRGRARLRRGRRARRGAPLRRGRAGPRPGRRAARRAGPVRRRRDQRARPSRSPP